MPASINRRDCKKGVGRIFTIAVADDDKVLRSGICKIIEEGAEDCQIVLEASNGLKVLKYLEDHAVDLLFTDIKMPVMDGVELIKAIAAKGYPTSVVVISGFSEYAFLRETMKYGAKDYLLKPISRQELLSLIEKIRSQKKARDIMRSVSGSFLEELNQNSYYRHESLIYSLVKNNELYSSLIREEDLDIKDVSWYLIALLHPGQVLPEPRRRSLLAALQKRLREELSLYSFPEGDRLVALFTFSCADAETAAQRARETVELMGESLHKDYGCPIRAACGRFVPSIKELYLSYNAACAAEEALFYESGACCFAAAEKAPVPTPPDMTAALQAILEAVRAGEEESAKFALRRLFEDFQQYAVPVKDVRDLCLLLYSQLVGVAGQKAGDRAAMDIILSGTGAEEIRVCLTRAVERAADAEHPGKTRPDGKNVIQKAQRYIRENFRRDISLKDVSQYVYLNATYFSELFKKETGEKFVDFLMRTRIDEARRILVEEPDILINEIGRMVGYNEPVSFNRAFKKLTGCTPVCYRMKNRR